MADPITRALATRAFLVLDGALATELERRGADLRDPLWSANTLIERPEMIQAVHLDYFLAGADIATTSTYQASFEGFGRRGISRVRAEELMASAVSLAAAARATFWSQPAHRIDRLEPLIAASVGPYGAMLADGSEYRGRYAIGDGELADFHYPRLAVLARSGADLIACETLPCLREALVLARLLAEFPSLSAWISFSCRDGAHNSQGEQIAECAAALDMFPHIAALGINCTAPQYVAELLARMRAHTKKPLIAYPNSGQTYDAAAKRWSGAAPRAPLDPGAPGCSLGGARLIGGCCRTGPEDVRGLCKFRAELAKAAASRANSASTARLSGSAEAAPSRSDGRCKI
jgi:homocysteine S-methyltransferase